MNYTYQLFKKKHEKMPITPQAIGMGLAAAQQAGQILGIGRGQNDKRQLQQQQDLTDQQVRAQKDMARYSQQMQMDMWHQTNYGAQIAEMQKAGLNPALIYGQGGGGGATTGSGASTGVGGGQAANAAATQQADQQGMMLGAQIKLLEAQTRKTNVEADKAAGVDTEQAKAQTASISFQNELNKTIGMDDMVKRYQWANQMLETQNAKQLAEYNAWQASGFEGKATDDPTSPMAKAMSAGLQKAIQDLQGAKLANNAQELTNVVKAFEARLAEQGIHPHSPWWTKLLTDMLSKVGLTGMIQDGMKAVKVGY